MSVSDGSLVRRSAKAGVSSVVSYVSKVPILQVSIGVVLGCAAGASYSVLIGIFVVVLFVGSMFRKWIGLGIGLLVIGVRMLCINEDLPNNHISNLNGEDITIEVVVSENIVRKAETTRIVVEAEKVLIGEEENRATGDVLTWLPRFPRVHEGDVLRLSGRLLEPTDDTESDFSYKAYLETKGIYSLIYRPQVEYEKVRKIGVFRKLIVDSRDALVFKLNRLLPEPHSSLLAGILCGVRASMPEDFDDALRKTGTTHIIAASGYNVTLVANFIASILGFVHRRWRILLSIGGIWLFVIFSGSSLPVIRAGVMVTLAMFAILSGNMSNIHLALPLSASIMIMFSPGIVSDISFQLSFVSTAGLIYLVPVLQRFFPWVPESIQDATLVTLAAILATTPLIVGTFGSISVVAPIVNFLVLPVVGIVMAGGVMLVIIPSITGVLLKVVSLLVWVPLEFFVKVVGLFAQLPFASIEIEKVPGWFSLAGYLIIALIGLKYYPGSSETLLIKDLRV